MLSRQVTAGSRQAPDPLDIFLEENHFYRKHTARDSSCLFRVISEQLYDTQLHHLAIRRKCVLYMRKNREFFQKLVDRDLDDYLDDMSKPKTYGTLVELQAAGLMFQRNIVLFEPFNLGNIFNNVSRFTEVFRVFYTPERHFDSVFTVEYIKKAAVCQALCFELLYRDLFKLPDVNFAVEQMLHSTTFDRTDYHSEYNEEGYTLRIVFRDGLIFDFDLPFVTNCILENNAYCHFHNQNFGRQSHGLDDRAAEGGEERRLIRISESSLPNKYISCVRQLLLEGITPFPYKVAKALDSAMYRNIEFDSWNEVRKELRLQNWYNGDANFKVGAKCHVRLLGSDHDLYTCHIQEIAQDKKNCLVYVEEMGEKRLVPYEHLKPLPPEQFKPWSLPYRFSRQLQKYSHAIRYMRQLDRYKMGGSYQQSQGRFTAYATFAALPPAEVYDRLKPYMSLDHFQPPMLQYCTMPMTTDQAQMSRGQQTLALTNESSSNESPGNAANPPPANELGATSGSEGSTGGGGGDASSANGEPVEMVPQVAMVANPGGGPPAIFVPQMHIPMQHMSPENEGGHMQGEGQQYTYEGVFVGGPGQTQYVANSANHGGTVYYMYNSAGMPLYSPAAAYVPQTQAIFQAPPVGHPNAGGQALVPANAVPVNAFYTGGQQVPMQPQNMALRPYHPVAQMPPNYAPMVRQGGRQLGGCGGEGDVAQPTTPLNARINYDARKSVRANGSDLPPDVATLRYFYNLGLEYHRYLRGCEENETSTNLNADMYQLRLEGAERPQEPKVDYNNNMLVPFQGGSGGGEGGVGYVPSNAGRGFVAVNPFNGQPRPMQHRNNNNNNGGGHIHPHRAMGNRFNNRDRSMGQPRRVGGGGGGGGMNESHHHGNMHQGNNHNKGNRPGPHQAQQNGPRHQTMSQCSSNASNGGPNGGRNSSMGGGDVEGSVSPINGYEGGEMPHQHGMYEQGGQEGNGNGNAYYHPQQAMPQPGVPNNGNVYVQVAPSQYGMYTPAPGPSPQHGGMQGTPHGGGVYPAYVNQGPPPPQQQQGPPPPNGPVQYNGVQYYMQQSENGENGTPQPHGNNNNNNTNNAGEGSGAPAGMPLMHNMNYPPPPVPLYVAPGQGGHHGQMPMQPQPNNVAIHPGYAQPQSPIFVPPSQQQRMIISQRCFWSQGPAMPPPQQVAGQGPMPGPGPGPGGNVANAGVVTTNPPNGPNGPAPPQANNPNNQNNNNKNNNNNNNNNG